MCFFAAPNSIFYGDKLLTTPNPDTTRTSQLFAKLGLHPMRAGAQYNPESDLRRALTTVAGAAFTLDPAQPSRPARIA